MSCLTLKRTSSSASTSKAEWFDDTYSIFVPVLGEVEHCCLPIQWISIEISRDLTSAYETCVKPDMTSSGCILYGFCYNSSSPHAFLYPLAPYSGRRKGARYTVKPGGSLKVHEN